MLGNAYSVYRTRSKRDKAIGMLPVLELLE